MYIGCVTTSTETNPYFCNFAMDSFSRKDFVCVCYKHKFLRTMCVRTYHLSVLTFVTCTNWRRPRARMRLWLSRFVRNWPFRWTILLLLLLLKLIFKLFFLIYCIYWRLQDTSQLFNDLLFHDLKTLFICSKNFALNFISLDCLWWYQFAFGCSDCNKFFIGLLFFLFDFICQKLLSCIFVGFLSKFISYFKIRWLLMLDRLRLL